MEKDSYTTVVQEFRDMGWVPRGTHVVGKGGTKIFGKGGRTYINT
jgi:hypothetical protein